MFSKDRILTLDVGASRILLCEFSLKGSSPLTLLRAAEAPLDSLAPDAAPPSLATLGPQVRDLMKENGIQPAPLYLMVPGQQIFVRAVKIPAASGDMADQLVAAEAAEGLPFPLDQVVWDYQSLGIGDTGDLETLIVAAKSDTAFDAAALAAGAGSRLELVDAAPLALYNAVRYNEPDQGGCTLVLDVGAKATNLVFVEGSKVFMRTIPVAGNAVTQEIARGLGAEIPEAEEYKKQVGFVALGGTYGVPDDETADRASKLVRNVATRLHSEVNRSVNFYRSQQGGSAPDRVLLTGGSSMLRHLDTFFQEKLGVPVTHFNPLANVAVAPGLQVSDAMLLSLAPSVGLALRAAAKCPVEINLLPSDIVEERRFRRRLPFFGVAVAGVALTLLCWYLHANNKAAMFEENASVADKQVKRLNGLKSKIAAIRTEADAAVASRDYLASVAASRCGYAEVLDAVRAAMLPDTMIQSLAFSNADGTGETPPAMRLVVRGFTEELNGLAGAKSASGKRQSAGEMLLANLLKSPLFAREPKKGMRSLVEREVRLEDNENLTEIPLTVYLSRPLGVFSTAWTPVPDAPAPEPGEGGDDGAGNADEAAEEDAE
ncbi:MAG: pilus assembly protein PilM [Kiritimatiellae bacterium]|nr:pilus assembly protein PilM [Kiritimatiellia bacterium]